MRVVHLDPADRLEHEGIVVRRQLHAAPVVRDLHALLLVGQRLRIARFMVDFQLPAQHAQLLVELLDTLFEAGIHVGGRLRGDRRRPQDGQAAQQRQGVHKGFHGKVLRIFFT